MTISKHISKGEQHKVYCEDFLIDIQLNTNLKLLGVFDGCSSGINSHFASAIFGNAIISSTKNIELKDETDVLLKNILWQSIQKIKQTSQILNLSSNELLTTIILNLIDFEKQVCSIIAIGDGLIALNQEVIKIEQNNMPDYLVYHFYELENYSGFDNFINKQVKFDNKTFTDITISTDGIYSFTNVNSQISENEIVDYFVKDEFLKNNQAMLSRKHNILKTKYNATNLDDLAIIRITSNNSIL